MTAKMFLLEGQGVEITAGKWLRDRSQGRKEEQIRMGTPKGLQSHGKRGWSKRQPGGSTNGGKRWEFQVFRRRGGKNKIKPRVRRIKVKGEGAPVEHSSVDGGKTERDGEKGSGKGINGDNADEREGHERQKGGKNWDRRGNGGTTGQGKDSVTGPRTGKKDKEKT